MTPKRPDEIGVWPGVAAMAFGVFLIALGKCWRVVDDNLEHLGEA